MISLPFGAGPGSTRRVRSTLQTNLQVGERTESLTKDASKEDGGGIEPTQHTRSEPWRASYNVSKKTQSKIQQAAHDRGTQKRSGSMRASAVLQTLLDTPAERCNAANLVCALTLSAKAMGCFPCKTDAKFRSLLFKALHVLHDLVEKRSLSPRQLCNAVWAVAKHYDRDPLLLPKESPDIETISSMHGFVAETWNLKDEGNHRSELSPDQLVDATVEAIARQLAGILAQEATEVAAATEQSERGEMARRQIKLGELCMVTWAYGILRPRRQPPGWLRPPRMGNLLPFLGKVESERKNDFITFEQWTMNEEDLGFLSPKSDVESAATPADAADELFDAIGEALCRPLPYAAPFNSTNSVYGPQCDHLRLMECAWSEIANLAWAFEKRGRSLSAASETLLRALSREAAYRLRTGGSETRQMLSRDISQLIWALGTLQQDNFRLAHDLVALVDDFSVFMGLDRNKKDARPFEKWSCPDIVQTVLSLSHARIDDSQLLLSLFQEAHRRLTNGICTDSRQGHGRKHAFT
jgi:hypothetical protein